MPKTAGILVGSILLACLLVSLEGGRLVRSGEIWAARYDGLGKGYDSACAIAVDRSGNVVVTGLSTGTRTRPDYATLKYGPNGKLLWEKRFQGNASIPALALDGSGNVHIVGNINNKHGGENNFDYLTIKYSGSGKRMWIRTYDGGRQYGHFYDDTASDIAVDRSGNVYVIGERGLNSDYATVKYSANGQQLWVKTYNGKGEYSHDSALAVAVDDSGNVLVTGTSDGGLDWGDEEFTTVKYTSDGRQLWAKTYHGPYKGWHVPTRLVADRSGNVLVAGYCAGKKSGYDNSIWVVIKYGPAGDQMWTAKYDLPNSSWDELSDMAVDGSGNVFVTGMSLDSQGYGDYATIKYDRNGKLIWVKRFIGDIHGDDYASSWAKAIAVDGSGNIYVTGESARNGGDFVYATVKYSPSGEELWVGRYKAPDGGHSTALAVAVGAAGKVYVTGESESRSGSESDDWDIWFDYVTVKYDLNAETLRPKK